MELSESEVQECEPDAFSMPELPGKSEALVGQAGGSLVVTLDQRDVGLVADRRREHTALVERPRALDRLRVEALRAFEVAT